MLKPLRSIRRANAVIFSFGSKGHTAAVTSLTYSPDGKRLASAGGDRIVKVWDSSTGKAALTLIGHTGKITSVTYSPDGKHLATASDDKTVKVWVASTGQECLTLKGHTAAVTSVTYSPDGKRLASASDDKTVKVWDTFGREVCTLTGHTAPVTSVAYSPDGQRLASADDGSFSEEDIRLMEKELEEGRVRVRREKGKVKVWDPLTGQEVLSLQFNEGGKFKMVVFSPDSKRLACIATVGIRSGEELSVWDIDKREVILSRKGSFLSAAYSPDGKRLATAGLDRTVKLWEATTGQEVFTIQGDTSPVASVAFSPDGKRLAGGYGDGTVKAWDGSMDQATPYLAPKQAFPPWPDGIQVMASGYVA
jgi:WD40 repeat protein